MKRTSARRSRRLPRKNPLRPNKRDWRGTKVRANIRRQVNLMAQHPEDDILNEWIEATYDWDAWK